MASTSTSTQLLAGAAIAFASLLVGYQLGANSLKAASNASATPATLNPAVNSSSSVDAAPNAASEEGSDDEAAADGDLSMVKAGWTEPCKLVLIVRTDLNMSPGKIAAQCSHAALACYKALAAKNAKLVRHWETTGQAKIALKASSEDQLLELEAIARSLNLCARSIHDAGRTQVAAGSRTVLGIGPGPVELINRVTGKLRLL